MSCFLFLFLLFKCYALKFSNRNHTHLLFEYTFWQNECENGYFYPNEYVQGLSFGTLQTKQSLECLQRSGYKSVGNTYGYAFESNSTIQSFLDRIKLTKEFSIEVWLNSGEQDIVNDAMSINNASLIIENYDIFHVFYSVDEENKLRSYYINTKAIQYTHYILTFKQNENTTHFQSYVNGTRVYNLSSFLVNLDAWDENSRMYGSYPRTSLGTLPRWKGEMYYLGFYDHVLTDEQIHFSFECGIPPSIPHIQNTNLHGDMNTRFPLSISIYDHNVNTQTNIGDGYGVSLRILSLPHRGTLYSSSMQPITILPPSGLLNTGSLYYEPIHGEHSEEVYTQFNVTVENMYGVSNPKALSIFVDWVNSAPVVPPKSFMLTTHQPLTVELEVVDVDDDKNYTRVVSHSPSCMLLQPTLTYNFSLTLQFVGGDNACTVELVVGDSHGLESNLTMYTFTVSNQIQPMFTSIHVNQGLNTTIIPVEGIPDLVYDILNNTQYGTMQVSQNASLIYYADPYFFSEPSETIYGMPLNNSDPIITYQLTHKGIQSPIFYLTIIVHHVNTPPSFTLPSSISFDVYDPVQIPNVFIQDYDRDTQLCTLRITTLTGFFIFNTTANQTLEWKEGNYGEGMDDNLLVVQGPISAMNYALHSLRYRAVYKLNDTMTISLFDGEFNITGKIPLLYQAKVSNMFTNRFILIVSIALAFLVLFFISTIWNCVNKCRKHKKKQLPITKKEDIEKQDNPSTSSNKKIPPPPPTSLPPDLSSSSESDASSDEIEPISKKSTKPPAVN